MNLFKLSIEPEVNCEEFILFWSEFYDYSEKVEAIYSERINNKEFTIDDIKKLYEWKNGGKLSGKKKESLNDKIIVKLSKINELKSNFNLDAFSKDFEEVSAIWKIYLLHIICPQEYPIFDQHVCRGFYFLKESKLKEIPSSDTKKEKVYFEDYVKFFNDLVDKNKRIPYKKIDEALWAFGKFLKKYRKTIAVELYRKEEISLGRASEITGLGYEKMKSLLIERGIPIRRSPEKIEELDQDYEAVKNLI